MTDKKQQLSMVVEIQFLFNFMKMAKSMGHGLYTVSRNEQFFLDLQTIMDIGKNTHNELLSALSRGDEPALARLLIS